MAPLAKEEIVLGASLGQCCGGAVTLRYRLLDDETLAAWPSPALPLVQLYGAGHVGRAVVRLLETLDVTVQWIDERSEAFPVEPSRVGIERICVEPVDAEVGIAPRGASYLVMTHQHDLDLRIVEAILRRNDFGFAGLIGSTTKRRRFEQQLGRRRRGAGSRLPADLPDRHRRHRWQGIGHPRGGDRGAIAAGDRMRSVADEKKARVLSSSEQSGSRRTSLVILAFQADPVRTRQLYLFNLAR